MKSCGFIFAGFILLTLTACGGGNSTGSSTPPTPTVHNEWTWVAGNDTGNVLGVYGTWGTASPNNAPGARAYAVSWTDAAGNFWLFGGYGMASSGQMSDLNDLWRYSNGEWAWMSGSNQTEQAGTYGTQGVADSANAPGARLMAMSWADKSGNLWLFGGVGVDSTGTRSNLNDLWKYSNGKWTWMGGSKIGAHPGIAGAWQGTGIYGTKGVPDPANFPGVRSQASTWTDPSGNLWLFGGFGVDSTGLIGLFNDLWKYSDGMWTWMAGSNTVDENPTQLLGVYGTLGAPAPSNNPGARFGSATWTDAEGNLWLFGGDGEDVDGTRCQQTGSPCKLSDLWRYSNGEWTWMGGLDQANEPGVYGAQGIAAAANIPTPRTSAVSWVDSAGNFWLFGGDGPVATDYNDLWKYSNGEWTWMSGANQDGQTGAYGTLGTAASSNVPGCRDGAVGWTDTSGNLWLFGGEETFCVGNVKLNDLWEYQP